MSHKLPEQYSGKNPVPQIATKLTALVNPERATEAKAAQLQDKSGQRDQKETQKRARGLAKGHVMRVVDPVTGDELEMKNADEEPDLRNKGENILSEEFPPLDWKAHRKRVLSFAAPSIFHIAVVYSICFLFARFTSGKLLSTVIALIFPACLTYALLFRLRSIAQRDFDDRSWESERTRGLRAGSDLNGDGIVDEQERVKESAEWANAVLRGVWPIMNPDLFGNLTDILEDIMQASVPRFVHSVRVSDVGLGSNAARITFIRSLPDSETQKQHEIDECNECAKTKEENGSAKDCHDQTPDKDEDEELNRQHVNLELSFAYRGLPSGQSVHSKARNIHLLVEFFLGIRGWYGFKVPVWVEIDGIVGTARARLHLISDPPFIKTTMITLLGLPRITISVVPLSRLLPNVMDLPFISGFISSSIDTAVAEYVAPKSVTINLQRLIRGDDVKKDTEAIGVIVVHIHRAKGVKKMDTMGSSDPYTTLTYSKLGKPLYSTRIIKDDCNPVFEETAVVLVDVNIIRLHEKLSLRLWDSDRMTVDDLLGVVEVDVVDLVRNHGEPRRRSERLSHPHDKHVPGELEYTVGYYAKRPPNPSLRSTGHDPGIPEDLQDLPEFKPTPEIAMNALEAAVLVTPPDPQWPSGIVSVQVHEIRGLGIKTEGRKQNVFKGVKSREGEKGQDQGDGEQEEGEGLPSSYCTISLNDELVYETRVKPITSAPIFNAGTERFVRDWRSAHIAVAVKDSRMRENDAVLGVVMLKLSDLLANASQITRLYSLENGIGYGRIRISVLFRPVEAKLPPCLLGFDTGTLVVHDLSIRLSEKMDMDLTKCEVRLKTTNSGADEKVSSEAAHRKEDGSVMWGVQDSDIVDLPVRARYGSALIMSFRDLSSFGLKHTARKALAVLWLRDLVDNHEDTVQVPLWHVSDGDYSRLKMNYSPPDGDLEGWAQERERMHRAGSAFVHVVFRPGISGMHHDTMRERGAKKREAWEVFTREQEGGLRDSVGEISVDQNGTHSDAENRDTDKNDRARLQEASTSMSPPVDAAKQTPSQTDDTHREESDNTLVSPRSTERIEHGDSGTDDNPDNAKELDGSRSGQDGEEKTGMIGKFKNWRRQEKELHREHKGIMQMKPARTAEWIKDSLEEGIHDAKHRFSMKGQKPGVETEV